MNLAVIGSGGREHAICYKLKQSSKIKKLFCIPGNAGTQKIAQNIKEAYPELILKDSTTDMLQLKTTSPAWNAIIISANKEQQAIINHQQSQIDELKKLILELAKNNI